MPIVKITKQLDRPDGGKVASGSIAVCNSPRQVVNEKAVVFIIAFFINQTAIDSGKTNIPQLVKFPTMKLVKMCSDDEWTELSDDAGAGALVGKFMKECIDAAIGDGFAELIG